MSHKQLLATLREKGARITKTRSSLLEILIHAKKPLSAETLLQKLSDEGQLVNKTTVYRELQFFAANGIVVEIFVSHEVIHYEVSFLKHHHHLVCESCGTIEEVAGCTTNAWEEKIVKEKGFLIKRHSLEFFGVCHNCQ